MHQLLAENNFKGFIESVPAYTSLAIFYDVHLIKKNYPVSSTVFDFVKTFTEQFLTQAQDDHTQLQIRNITIPVYYNGDDLSLIATMHQLSPEEVIQLHTSKIYRVFMLGFLPGFAYMGAVDERIATPRKISPRIKVSAGSVGIAGFQTGIYPLNSPGGWQLLGQTPVKIFDKKKENPCLLKAGDAVQFISISKTIFQQLNEY